MCDISTVIWHIAAICDISTARGNSSYRGETVGAFRVLFVCWFISLFITTSSTLNHLSANTLSRHFCWQLGSFHSASTTGINAEWNQAMLLVVGACLTVLGIRHMQEVTIQRDFNRQRNFYQAFGRNFSARTEFDLNHCRNSGNVFTLFISSIALHLIAERLACSTADTVSD